mmetsp:Transcript_23500/g.40101  ORF Transcript_23500/g.40101 Transcript_23500/m.40101 type:complete len:235 (-) Transcript_23500:138-842(-)
MQIISTIITIMTPVVMYVIGYNEFEPVNVNESTIDDQTISDDGADPLPTDAEEVSVPMNEHFSIVNPATGMALGIDSRGCTPYLLTFKEHDRCDDGQIFYLGEDGYVFSVGCPRLVLEGTGADIFGMWLQPPTARNDNQNWDFNEDRSIKNVGYGKVMEFGDGWDFVTLGEETGAANQKFIVDTTFYPDECNTRTRPRQSSLEGLPTHNNSYFVPRPQEQSSNLRSTRGIVNTA